MKSSIFFLLISGIILLHTGCSKELDLQPTDTFSENNSFVTLEDVQKGVNAIYSRYGGAYLSDMYANALVSDEAKLGPDNSGQGALTFRYQYASDGATGGDVTAAWGSYYSVIDQVNRVLPKVFTVEGDDDERRYILKGQLLAMRAISHFGLLQSYCKVYNPSEIGVPLMLESNPLAKPSRKTMGEVVAQIDADLTEAKSLLGNTDFSDTTLNRVNVAAYQARVALFKKDYDNAITYSTEVINSGARNLASRGNFPNIWNDNVTDEILFRIRYETSSAIGELWTTSSDIVYIAPSDKLFNSITTDDIRKSTFVGNTSTLSKRCVKKFYSSNRGGRIVHMKACRIAEMYLIRAEANARSATPNLTAGTADLNRLRSARISPYTNLPIPANSDALANLVLEERFRELCFEGFRLFDLKRNGLPVFRDASDASAEWQILSADNFRFVFPIPNAEILANSNMVQNSGYF